MNETFCESKSAGEITKINNPNKTLGTTLLKKKCRYFIIIESEIIYLEFNRL